MTSPRNSLIEAGVKNLKSFGYPNANKNNILTDSIYKVFFLGMLEDEANVTDDKRFEKARTDLIAGLKK